MYERIFHSLLSCCYLFHFRSGRKGNIVHPDDYSRLLWELSKEDSSENESDEIDKDSEEEIISKSNHDSDSEIEGEPELGKENYDKKSSESNFDGIGKEFFEKIIYKIKSMKVEKLIIKIYKWKKTPTKSKFTRTQEKRIFQKGFTTS